MPEQPANQPPVSTRRAVELAAGLVDYASQLETAIVFGETERITHFLVLIEQRVASLQYLKEA